MYKYIYEKSILNAHSVRVKCYVNTFTKCLGSRLLFSQFQASILTATTAAIAMVKLAVMPL